MRTGRADGKKMNNLRVDPKEKQTSGGSALIKELYMIEEEGKSPVKGGSRWMKERWEEGEGKDTTTKCEPTDVMIVRTLQRDMGRTTFRCDALG